MSKDNKLLGLDVFVLFDAKPEDLARALEKEIKSLAPLKLTAVTNRGTKVWPGPTPTIKMTDVFTCRFLTTQSIEARTALQLLEAVEKAGFTWVHVEKLFEMNGKPGFSSIQED